MPSRFWKAGGNALLPGSNVLVTASGAVFPATLGANNVLDFTNLSMANVYTDTGATTNITADGQTVKAIKDPNSGIIATNATGWVYHANSGKPYLAMDGSSFFNTSSFTFADTNGQFTAWITANMTNSNPWILEYNATTAFLKVFAAVGATGISTVIPVNAAGTQLTADSGPGVIQQGVDYVFSCIVTGNGTSGTSEAFTDNVGDGSTAYTGLNKLTDVITIGDSTPGKFYGLLMAKGDQTANRATAQTYMAALHP